LQIFSKKQKKNLLKILIIDKILNSFYIKKNKTFYLYINYRKLNNITIKNRYLLLNINKL